MNPKVLFIASECAPLAKVGGLADVVGSLPKTLKKLGVDVSVVIPFYGVVSIKDKNLKLFQKDISIEFAGKKENFSLWQTYLPESKVPVFLIKKDKYFKEGNVYLEIDASSGGSEKEAARFFFLTLAGIKIAQLINADIIHCQDWHVSLVPFLIEKEGLKNIKTLLTIHNLGYQGIYSDSIVNKLLGTDFPQDVNCLKLGISNADLISTVSPNYAKEILTPEYGFGLKKDLEKRKEKLVGIINGLDTDTWNPAKDSYLKSPYSFESLDKKIDNKVYLQKKFFKKSNPDVPLLGIVSRLAEQKGFDLIQKIFLSLMKKNINFVILGQGLIQYQNFFREKAKQYPKKIGIGIGFNEELAHQIYAGADMFLMPSFFEPCGLGQLIAMRYGTVPIVRETGGLKDTVLPVEIKGDKIQGTGFLFKNYKGKELLRTIEKSLKTFENKNIWRKIQINGMKEDYSWEESARQYLKVYRQLTE